MPVAEIIHRIRVTTYRGADLDAPLLTCTPADPFGIDHDCLNPAGHDPIVSCGDVVCRHCARLL